MKLIAVWIFCVLSLGPVQAAWEVLDRAPLPAPAGLEFQRLDVAQSGSDAELHVVTFRTKTHTFAVIDHPEGSGDLPTLGRQRGALAAVNGGYFHPDRRPLGLVISGGKTLHALERAKLLSGLVTASAARVAVLRAAEYKASPAIRDALQAGPLLVDGGKAVPGLNATRPAVRTVVFTDGAGRAGVLLCRSVTLAEMAQILAQPGLLPGWKITRALNLDGGSSSALWVDSDGKPFHQAGFRDVRNFLAIVPRASTVP